MSSSHWPGADRNLTAWLAQCGRLGAHRLGYVFLGWVIVSSMATFARLVYPAPRRTLLTPDRRDQASKG